jgi:hypothetical protein
MKKRGPFFKLNVIMGSIVVGLLVTLLCILIYIEWTNSNEEQTLPSKGLGLIGRHSARDGICSIRGHEFLSTVPSSFTGEVEVPVAKYTLIKNGAYIDNTAFGSVPEELVDTPDSTYIVCYDRSISKHCARCDRDIIFPGAPKYIRTTWRKPQPVIKITDWGIDPPQQQVIRRGPSVIHIGDSTSFGHL